jgi:hypothetical protein
MNVMCIYRSIGAVIQLWSKKTLISWDAILDVTRGKIY